MVLCFLQHITFNGFTINGDWVISKNWDRSVYIKNARPNMWYPYKDMFSVTTLEQFMYV